MAKNKDFKALDQSLLEITTSGLIPALQISVRYQNQEIFHHAYGTIASDKQQIEINPHTIFDITSLTRLFTAAAFMHLVETDKIQLDDPVGKIFEEFSGYRQIKAFNCRRAPEQKIDISHHCLTPVDSAKITFRQLLCDNSGLPAWLPLYQQPDITSAREAALHSFFCFQPGTDVLKSDIGYIILGWAIEKISQADLSFCIDEQILSALNLQESGFRPTNPNNKVPLPMPQDGVAPSERCDTPENVVIGEAFDQNCAFFNGICGHSGIFSTAQDLAIFGDAFIFDNDFLNAKSIAEITHLQSSSFDRETRNGLGFQLWSEAPGCSFAALGPESFGQNGCAGSALWIDPQRKLVIALLSNGSHCHKHREELQSKRTAIINCVLQDLSA